VFIKKSITFPLCEAEHVWFVNWISMTAIVEIDCSMAPWREHCDHASQKRFHDSFSIDQGVSTHKQVKSLRDKRGREKITADANKVIDCLDVCRAQHVVEIRHIKIHVYDDSGPLRQWNRQLPSTARYVAGKTYTVWQSC
jgi:hypothetical protein